MTNESDELRKELDKSHGLTMKLI